MAAVTPDTPVMPPPPGQVSNFINPDDRSIQLLVCGILLPILSVLFVTARMVTRIWIHRKTSSDDYFSVAAVVTQIAYTLVMILRIPNGEGKHMWDVRLLDFEPVFLQYYTASIVFATSTTSCAKISILLFLLHIFNVKKVTRWIIYLMIFVSGSMFFVGLFVAAFACSPPQKSWHPEIPGNCINLNACAIASAVINCATDIVIFILPLPLVWSLKLPTRLKLGLALIFATGGIVCVVSAVRLYSTVAFSNDPDLTWEIVTWDVASLFEFNFAIMVGCMPIIKSLIQHVAPRLLPESVFGTSHGSRYRGGPNSALRSDRSGGKGGRRNKPSAAIDQSATAVEMGSRSKKSVDTTGRTDSQEYLRESYNGTGIVKTVKIDATFSNAV